MYNRFHKVKHCFNCLHTKFQVAGFQNERDIRNRSLDFVCLFLRGHLLVQVTCRFLACDGSEIHSSVEDICYLLSHILIKFSIAMVCWSCTSKHELLT